MSTHIKITPGFSPARVGAMVLRYWYLLRSSLPRMLETAYWPCVQMVTWGFLTQFLSPRAGTIGQAFGILLAGAMLWDVMFRGQLGVAVTFFEEMYSRNLGHLLASPLTPVEFMISLLVMSLMRTLLGVVPASLLAIWFFGYSIYDLGPALLAIFVSLLAMGWAIGLAVSGMVMKAGLGAEGLAWSVIFALAPLSGIYYPISVLPAWLQPIAFALPSAHAFEAMRAVVHGQGLPWRDLGLAGGLDVIYLGLGMLAFLRFHAAARNGGRLLAMGE